MPTGFSSSKRILRKHLKREGRRFGLWEFLRDTYGTRVWAAVVEAVGAIAGVDDVGGGPELAGELRRRIGGCQRQHPGVLDDAAPAEIYDVF